MSLFAGVELSETSDKLYQMLRKRPDSEVIFNRFYDGCLGEVTIEELEQMLRAASVGDDASVNDSRLLAVFYLQQGEEVKALQVLRQATQKADTNGKLLLEQARLELALMHHSDALQSLEAALKVELDVELEIELRRMQGSAYSQLGQVDQAQEVWKQLLADYPDDRELMEDLIELQTSEGLLDQALETATQLVQQTREPYQKALYRIWMGDLYQRQERGVEALDLYSELLDQVGSRSWLERELLSKIEQVLSQGHGKVDAIAYYEGLLERYPQRIGIRQQRLLLLARSGDVDEALAEYQEILRLTPGDREQLEGYVRLLSDSGRLDAAIVELKKLCEKYPNDSELCLQLVELYSQVDDEAGLRESIETFAKSVGSEPYARLRVARLYERLAFHEDAGAIYAALASEHVDNFEVIESYAQWLHDSEETDDAVKLWIGLSDSQDRDGLLRIAQSLLWARQGEEAYKMLKRRVEEFSTDIIYLRELSQLAMTEEVAHEALPWVRTLVLKADTPLEVSSAVQLAADVVKRAEMLDTLILELQAQAEQGAIRLQELCLLAELEESQGDSLASEETLERLRAFGGVIALSEEVRIFENRGHYEEAIAALENLISLPNEKNPVNLRRLVNLFERERLWERALEVIAEWKKVSPGDAQVWMQESTLLENSNQLPLAQRQLRKAIHKFGDEVDLELRLASLLRRTFQYRAAERIYWKLYDRSDDSSDKLRWLNELGTVARESGDSDRYLAKLEELNKANRQSLTPLLAMADFYRYNHNLEQRRACLLEALRISPGNETVLSELATDYENRGDMVSAVATLKRLIEIAPSDANQKRLVQLLMRGGDQEAAYALIKKRMLSSSSDAAGVEGFVDLLMSSGEWEYAEVEAQKAYQSYPDDWRIGYQLAVCYIENFKEFEALELLLKLHGSRFELSRLHQKAGINSTPASVYSHSPEGTMKVMALLQTADRIYQYHRNRNYSGRHRSSPVGSALASTYVFLPTDVQALQRAVALQLGALASDMSINDQAAAIEKMEAAGVPYPSMLVQIQGARPQSQSWVPNFLLYGEAHPEQVELLPIMLNYSAYRMDVAVPKDRLLLGLEAFSEEYPMLKQRFALKLIQVDAENASQYVDMILEAIEDESVELDTNYILNSISQLLNLSSYGRVPVEEVSLDATQIERIRAIALAEYTAQKDQQNQPTHNYAYNNALNILIALALQEGDRSEFISLLENLFKRNDELFMQSQMQQQANVRRGHYGQQFQLVVPTFRPYQGGRVPALLTSLFVRRVEGVHPQSRRPGLSSAARFKQLAALDLYSHMSEITHPQFRYMVAWQNNDDEECEKILVELCNADVPLINDVMTLVAWQLDYKKDPSAALQTLFKAHKSSVQSAQRDQFDRMLIAVSLKVPAEELAELGYYDELKSAALRLRSSAQRVRGGPEQLISAMNSLGMKEEAAQLQESIQRKAVANTSSSLRFVGPKVTSSGGRQDPLSKMEALATEGKMEASLAIAVRQLQPAFIQAETNKNALRSIAKRLDKVGLSDVVLERFEPGESVSRRKREYYGLLLDALGRHEAAALVWMELHQQRPNVTRYAMEVAFSGEEADVERVLSVLLEARAYRLIDDEIGTWILQAVQHGNTNTFEQWVRLMVIGEILLKHVEPNSAWSHNYTWAPYLGIQFAKRTNINGQQFPNFINLRRNSQQNKDKDSDLAKNTRIREDVYERLCTAMIRHPQVAEQGFMLLYLKRQQLEQPTFEDPDFYGLARSALLTGIERTVHPNQSQQQGRQWMFSTHYYGSHSTEVGEDAHPLIFLMRYAHQTPGVELDFLAEELAAADSELAVALEAIVAMQAGEGGALSEPFLEWMTGSKSLLEMYILLEAFHLTEVNDPALIALIECGARQIETGSSNSQRHQQLCRGISAVLLKKGRSDLIDQWLDALTIAYLGPKEEWPSIVENFDQSHRYQRDSASYQLSSYWQFTYQISGERDLVLPLIRYTSRNGLGLNASSLNTLRSSLNAGFPSVEEAIEWCATQGLFTEFSEFDPLLMLDSQSIQNKQSFDQSATNRNSVTYERALRDIRFHGDSSKKEMQQRFIAELKTKGFGGQILAAFNEGTKGKQTAIDALEAHADAFFAMDPAQQQSLAYLYKYWLKGGGTSGDTRVVAHLERIWNEEMIGIASEYLDVDTAMNDQLYRQEQSQVRKWIAELIWDAPELCAQLYMHWLKREDGFIPQHGNSTPSQRILSNRRIMESAMDKARQSPTALKPMAKYIAAVEAQGGISNTVVSRGLTSNMGEIWRYFFESKLDSTKPSASSILQELPGLSAEFSSLYEKQFSALGLYQYCLSRFSYNSKDVDEISKLLESIGDDATIHERMFRAGILIRFSRHDKNSPIAAEALAGLLEDDTIPLNIRVPIWMSAQSHSSYPWKYNAVLAVPTCDLISEYLNANYSLFDGDWSDSLKRMSEAFSSAGWHEPMQALLPQFVAALPAKVYENDRRSAGYIVQTMIRIAVGLEDFETIRSVVNQHFWLVKGDSRVLYELIAAGEIDLAYRVTADDGQFSRSSLLRYTPEFHAHLPGYLEKLSNPMIRSNLEVELNCLDDATGLSETEIPVRAQRCEQLLADFKPQFDEARTVVQLSRLCSYTSDHREAIVHIEPLIGQRTYLEIVKASNTGSSDQRRAAKERLKLYKYMVSGLLRSGTGANVERYLKFSKEDLEQRSVQDFVRELQGLSSKAFLEGLEHRTTEEWASMLPFARNLLEAMLSTDSSRLSSYRKYAYYAYLLSHIGAGSADQIDTDLSAECAPRLIQFKERWDRPESLIRELWYWTGRKNEQTARRRAAMVLLLSNHAKVESIWATSPKALQDALRGSSGTDTENDLLEVLAVIDTPEHPRADWISLLRASLLFSSEESHFMELIPVMAPTISSVKTSSELRDYQSKLSKRLDTYIAASLSEAKGDPTFEDMLEVIVQINSGLSTSEELHLAASVLYYSGRNSSVNVKDLSKELLKRGEESELFLQRVYTLGVLVRHYGASERLDSRIRVILTEIAGNKELPFYFRFEVFRDVANSRYSRAMIHEVDGVFAGLLVEYLENGYQLNNNTVANVFRMYYQHPLDTSLEAQFLEVQSAWSKALLQDPQYVNSSYTLIARYVILLSLKMEDVESAVGLLKHYDRLNLSNIDMLTWFIRFKEYDHAIALMKQRDLLGRSGYGYGYDDRLHSHLPEFLELFDDAAEKYRIKVMLGSLADTTQAQFADDTPSRRDRCLALLQNYSEHRGDAHADRILDLITIDEHLEARAQSELENTVGHLSMREFYIQAQENKRNYIMMSLYVKYLSNLSRLDSLTRIQDEIAYLQSVTIEDDDYRWMRSRLEKLHQRLKCNFLDYVSSGKTEQLQAWLVLSQHLRGLYSNSSFPHHARDEFQMYLLNVMAQQAAAPNSKPSAEMLAQMSNSKIDSLLGSYKLRCLSNLGYSIGNGSREEDRERLTTALRLFLSNSEFLDEKWIEHALDLPYALSLNTDFERACLRQLLNEYITVGHSHEPWMAYVLADYCYAPFDDKQEEAIKWYRRAYDSALKRDDRRRTTAGDSALKLAHILQDSDEGRAEAIALLRDTPEDAYSESALVKAKEALEILAAGAHLED